MAREGDRIGDLALPEVDDAVFVALSDRVRRFALYYLRWRGSVDVEELADVVAGWRHADQPGAVARAERDRIRTALLDRHLQVLADANLVAVDEEAGWVSIEPLSEPVRSLVDFAYDAEGGDRDSGSRF